MKKNPLVMALLIVGAIFIFCVIIALFLSRQPSRGDRFALGDKVGVIEMTGVITSATEILEDLRDFREDSAIKAIVLRIDSPGGSVAPSQEIHDAVKKTAELKPVVVSMGSVAASGGYYIAVAETDCRQSRYNDREYRRPYGIFELRGTPQKNRLAKYRCQERSLQGYRLSQSAHV